MAKRRVGAVIYPVWEILDTFGPLEMYSVLGTEAVEICVVAEQAGPVPAALGADGPLGPRTTPSTAGTRTRIPTLSTGISTGAPARWAPFEPSTDSCAPAYTFSTTRTPTP